MSAPITAQDRWEHRDVKWNDLDKTKFFQTGCLAFLCVRAVAYPATQVKTRLQVGTASGSTREVFSVISREEGIRGFYRGFATASLGMVPAQCIYLSVYEYLRDQPLPFKVPDAWSKPVQTFGAGACASTVSQLVLNPMDVASQRLMVDPQRLKYQGATDVFRDLVRSEGLRGLYRGFFATICVSAPSSAIWWTTYTTLKPLLLDKVYHSDETETTAGTGNDRANGPIDTSVHAVCGLLAGVTAATATNPLDVLKTRLQVNLNTQETGLRTTLRNLLNEEGWRGLWRGLSARVLHTAPASVLSILLYETLKEHTQLTREGRA